MKEGGTTDQVARKNCLGDQKLVEKNLGEEGHAYHHAKNIKLRTGIVEEALALTDADQAKASSRVKEGYWCKLRII